jgi:hypothetical protein
MSTNPVNSKPSGETLLPGIISILVIVGFFVILFVIMFVNTPQTEQNILFLLLGTVSSEFKTVVSYWLNTTPTLPPSESEIEKVKTQNDTTKILAEAAQTTAQTAQTTAQTAQATAEAAKIVVETTTKNTDSKSS